MTKFCLFVCISLFLTACGPRFFGNVPTSIVEPTASPTVQAVPTFTNTPLTNTPLPTIPPTPTSTKTLSNSHTISTTMTVTATVVVETATPVQVSDPTIEATIAPTLTIETEAASATIITDTQQPATSTPRPELSPSPVATNTPVPIATATATQPAPKLNLRLELVTEGLFQPVFVTDAGDASERLFIVEQPGVIRIYQDGELLEPFFLDVRERVGRFGNEQGFLGLAFAPDFATSGTFFVNYTDQERHTVVARFQVSEDDPNLADPESEVQILRVEQPEPNHNGGMLLFGPDNYLYIGLGDGGGADDTFENGQNPNTFLGKMLRLDVLSDPSKLYAIPKDNPWVNKKWQDKEVRDEIWAMGLRNPWRYSFDSKTGALWVGDVGQNRYEEINYVPAGSGGLNFGWPIMEGLHCHPRQEDCDPSGLTLPVAEYSHQGHCSVTGGYVYRGKKFPALEGVYLYGDFCSGAIWAIFEDDAQGWRSELILQSDTMVSSFGEDQNGEIYVTDYRGRLLQVVLRE